MSAIKSFKPLFDKVLIQRIVKTESKTAGGIYLPTSVSNKINEALVIEVGTGRRSNATGAFLPTLLKKGDRVLLGETKGEKINVNGVDCEILHEAEILGLME
ncbi:chaperonin Cpn10 family protein [Cavenderia fasciculata]|uniref:20 kDa chaperonin, chloroplastic n=1 Tax=Cavenderia fasciculata TaxID=261658 RepID=F4PQH4_CACFS|nr:chaperonin Cpn10 family protein [Cavenderia fasciculata]EGG22637.1 chaperonin Cpn10 family protein [Cavenderia fasciculata]|eukprot:XP_004360488.1 chaperonin Cpn10 family protein [Cavenderia fasciculata]